MECNEREAETIVDQQKLLLYFLFYQQTGVCVYVRLAVGVCVGVRERVCVNIYQKTDTRGRCTVAVLGTAPDPLAGVPCPRSYGTERDRNMTEIQSFRGFQSHRERNSEHVILTILSLLLTHYSLF